LRACRVARIDLAAARLNWKEKFSLRAFHDYLRKNGNVAISLLRWNILGLGEENETLDAPTNHWSVLTHHSSLIRRWTIKQ